MKYPTMRELTEQEQRRLLNIVVKDYWDEVLSVDGFMIVVAYIKSDRALYVGEELQYKNYLNRLFDVLR